MTMRIETISEPETKSSSSSDYDYDYEHEHRLRLSTEPKLAVPTTKMPEEPKTNLHVFAGGMSGAPGGLEIVAADGAV
jgi:hypothetical protein